MRFLSLLALVLLLTCPLVAQKRKGEVATPPPFNLDVSGFEPGLYTLINTQYGTIVAQLFEKDVPKTVENFVGLSNGTKPWIDPKTKKAVARPLYDNITFHRVISQFMIQTGDPTGTGSHNCGFFLADEIVPKFKFNRAGRLAMANGGTPNSGACQWFITEGEYPAGDGKYTIFGQVMDGIDIVHKIARVITDDKDKPRIPIRLISVKLLRIAAPAEKTEAK